MKAENSLERRTFDTRRKSIPLRGYRKGLPFPGEKTSPFVGIGSQVGGGISSSYWEGSEGNATTASKKKRSTAGG